MTEISGVGWDSIGRGAEEVWRNRDQGLVFRNLTTLFLLGVQGRRTGVNVGWCELKRQPIIIVNLQKNDEKKRPPNRSPKGSELNPVSSN